MFNTLEYVLLDLVLAIFVYVLISKLASLYNCYDALKNHRSSHICEDTSAPLFETGIVSTKKKVFYVIVAIRVLSWILIFSTNLFIRGSSRKIREQTTAAVTMLAWLEEIRLPMDCHFFTNSNSNSILTVHIQS